MRNIVGPSFDPWPVDEAIPDGMGRVSGATVFIFGTPLVAFETVADVVVLDVVMMRLVVAPVPFAPFAPFPDLPKLAIANLRFLFASSVCIVSFWFLHH